MCVVYCTWAAFFIKNQIWKKKCVIMTVVDNIHFRHLRMAHRFQIAIASNVGRNLMSCSKHRMPCLLRIQKLSYAICVRRGAYNFANLVHVIWLL